MGSRMVTDLLTDPPVLPGIDKESVVLIAGGSGAIGSRCAAVLSRMGARTAILGRSPDRVSRCARAVTTEGEVFGLAGDITSRTDIDAAVHSVTERWSRLDGLVNLAAVGDSGQALQDVTEAEVMTVVRTNLVGAVLLAQACARVMKPQARGCMVNVATIGAHRVTPGRITYGPAKAGLVHLTRQLAVELGPHGIRVNSVSPGQTPTSLRRYNEEPGKAPVITEERGNPTPTKRIPLARRGRLDDYVGAILFFLSGLSSYVTGADLLVDGGAAILR
jgi:NAD(P)-dependent dehydrogenase (short-subunit alcohol dehydrogenase family)